MRFAVWLFGALLAGGCSKEKADVYVPRPKGSLTFSKHIAPIIYEQCASCHRPGQAAPFSLLTHADVRKRARQIAEVTASRYMPPWMPAPGYVQFEHERRLTADQIGMIQQWSTEGAVEGNAADLPPLPKWSAGWQLGQPDLVVAMPAPYLLSADGKDVYRNFVIPISLAKPRYVKAVEFNPGNWKIVHHAFFRFDRTGECRALDAQDAEPGFEGLHTPISAQAPPGHFLSWQPGKVFSQVAPGLAWDLETNSDLILSLHLQPTGKPETLEASMGFYFTEEPPTNTPFKISLSTYDIDIPPGARDYSVTDSMLLPVDVEVLGVLPHAHYLATEVQGTATLPDGSKRWLLKIDRWDFNWQGDYRYAKPIFLPKGTTVAMKFTFDNTAQNPGNPNHPPKRVRYGLETTDAMAELWLQVLTANRRDYDLLTQATQGRYIQDMIAFNNYLLTLNPSDARAFTGLGKAMYFSEKFQEAWKYFHEAVRINPALDEPHYFVGLMFRRQNRLPEARQEFLAALQLNPRNGKAAGNAGVIFLQEGNLGEAELYFSRALEINAEDDIARRGLNDVLKLRGGR